MQGDPTHLERLYIYYKGESVEIVLGILAIGIWLACFSVYKKKRRREALLLKYGDADIVDRIMGSRFWQGQTDEQLLDSLGRPIDIDERVLKTKVKQIWKYNQTAKNRFALRITVENGVVVGWEQK